MTRRRSCLLVAAFALVGAACGSGSSSSSRSTVFPDGTTTVTSTTTTPATTTPATTAVVTTAAPPTAVVTTVPTTVPAPTTTVTVGTCHSRVGSVPVPSDYNEAGLDAFGPIAPAPALTITIGATANPGDPGTTPAVWPQRIQGGVLLALSPTANSTTTTEPTPPPKVASAVAVNLDGSVRFVDCFAADNVNLYAADPVLRPTFAVVELADSSTSGISYTRRFVALTDGAVTPGFDAAATTAGIDPTALRSYSVVASGPAALVLGRLPDPSTALPADPFVWLDLASGVMRTIPVPKVTAPTAGSCSADPAYTFGPSGDFEVFFGRPEGGGPLAASWPAHAAAGTTWTTDPALLRQALPVRAAFACATEPLAGVDATGAEVWKAARYSAPQLEGARLVSDGGISVTQATTTTPTSTSCGCEVIAVDNATGAVRWSMPGWQGIGDAANGVVLVTRFDPANGNDLGQALLSVATGKVAAAGQEWTTPRPWESACCGDAEYIHTTRFGGVLVAVNMARINVWLPVAKAGPTVKVTL